MQKITNGKIVRQFEVAAMRLTETLHTPDLRLAPHDHDNANLNIVIEGGLDEVVERAAFTCPKYSLLLKPAGAQHSNAYGKELTRCLIVEFLPTFADTTAKQERMQEVAFAQNHEVRVIARQLSSEFSMQDSASTLVLEGIVLQLLGTLCRWQSARETTFPKWLDTARELLESHAGSPSSISALANRVQVDRSHLSREFLRHFGVTPGEYVRRLRLRDASELLRITPRTIAQIACDTGFSDQSHFTRAFTQYMGMTPTTYRRACSPQKHQNLTPVLD